MSRKVSELLLKLSLTDVNSSEFIAVSKQIAEAYKEYTKKKLDKEGKEPKPKKEKVKKSVLCENCTELIMPKVSALLTVFKKDEPKHII
jgi:hypothetical protein